MTKQNQPDKRGGQRPAGKGARPNTERGGRPQGARPAGPRRDGKGQPSKNQRFSGTDRKGDAQKGKKSFGSIPPAKPYFQKNRDMGYEETNSGNRQYNQYNRRASAGFQGPMNRPKRGPQRAYQQNREQPFVSPAQQRFGPGSKKYRPQHQSSVDYGMPAQAPHMEQDLVAIPEDLPQVNLLTGRNPIREAVKTGRDLEKLMIAKGELSGSAREIVSMAKKAGIMIQSVERSRLDQLAKNHQGMIAFASAYQYATVDEILAVAKDRGEDPFIIVLDQITDPHNLGAVIRTASCTGAHGVIVPQHRAVGLTPAAVKASAGAVEHIKVARVTNLNQTMKALQKKGIWFYGADTEGEDYRTVSFDGPCALVIGSEGEGISRLILSNCDRQVKIPMAGDMSSLNASVAAGILMYGVFDSRKPSRKS